ncbi:hypothetical protein DL95DRAFT_456544 [Leptodontidium sp. 2 PMI_412]|nr:hypothetical protein DL95DRAFT_456544 [Leptodontidium sp. 2 PMI_412]
MSMGLKVEREVERRRMHASASSSTLALLSSSFTLQCLLLQDFFQRCQGQAMGQDIFTSTDPPSSGPSVSGPVVSSCLETSPRIWVLDLVWDRSIEVYREHFPGSWAGTGSSSSPGT